MRRVVGLVFVATMLLFATSTVAIAATSPTAEATTTAKVKAAGISVKYPKSWIAVPLTKKGLAAQTKALSKKNPKLAAVVAATDISQFKLRAIDPTTGRETVGVQFIEGSGSPSSLSDFNSVIPQYKAAGATVLDTKVVKISGKTAFRIDMTLPVKLPDGSVAVQRVGQVVVPGGDSAAAVVAAGPDDDSGVAVINSILASVRRL
jgi:hypothetical protein